MALDRCCHRRAVSLPEHGTALDVRKEEGDSATWKVNQRPAPDGSSAGEVAVKLSHALSATMCKAGRRATDCNMPGTEGKAMSNDAGDRIETIAASKTKKHAALRAELADGEPESDADAVAAERTGRTNTARDMLSGSEQEPPPGRWDSIGEPGEGLDELQGLYAADATSQEQLPEQGDEPSLATSGPASPAATTITPALWDQLTALQGKTIETPKGEPFRVIAVTRGERVTVSPLDGGQEWDVPAQALEAGWLAVRRGAALDGLASIRLQEAGVGSAHPEYLAGLLQALPGEQT
jgi:hypothetical protein